MNFGWSYGTSAPHIMKAKIAATFATPGLYATVTAADGAGIVVGLRTTVGEQVGVAIDTGTYSTTQGATEGVVSLITDPLAVYKMRARSGTTAAADLDVTTNSAANTAGTGVTITTGDPVPNSPTMDEGTLICVSGANLGQSRKITSVSATVYTVTVPFLNDIAVGDQFIAVPWTPFDTAGDNINLDYTILNAQQNVAVATGADIRPILLELDTSSVVNAQRNSAVYGMLLGHVAVVGT